MKNVADAFECLLGEVALSLENGFGSLADEVRLDQTQGLSVLGRVLKAVPGQCEQFFRVPNSRPTVEALKPPTVGRAEIGDVLRPQNRVDSLHDITHGWRPFPEQRKRLVKCVVP